MSKSVLVISYIFPPVGGAGVQRVTKFVKYLPELGWSPIVLTAENPSVPLFDETLLLDVPHSVEVFRAKTMEPGYQTKQSISAASDTGNSRLNPKLLLKTLLRRIAITLLQPDPQVLWLPGALRKAREIFQTRKPEVIFVTAPPFSSLILGAMLARKYQVPLVLDYRDEWDISNSVWENKRMGTISLALQKRMQNYAIKAAKAIIATTKLSAEALETKVAASKAPAKVHCIYNGYDAADFAGSGDTQKDKQHYVLSYVGTLWNLTSIEPLVKAIAKLSADSPELASKLKLVIAGRRTARQDQLLAAIKNLPVKLVLHDYLDHAEAIKLMLRSQELILLLSNLEFARRVVPGKIFEYFATGNTILAISPKGEVWKLLADYKKAYTAEPSDIEAIASHLETEIQKFVSGQHSDEAPFNSTRYERKELTKSLVKVLVEVLTH